MQRQRESAIVDAIKHDEARLRAVESMPPDVQMRYEAGILKLRRRISDERAAVGLAPENTEAWAKHLLDGVDYYRSDGAARLVNQYLMLVEGAREAADLDAMRDAQGRLDRLIRDIREPEQMQFRT